MTPTVEQIYLTAINESKLYPAFKLAAIQTKRWERYYISKQACQIQWMNLAWRAIEAYNGATGEILLLTMNEKRELAYCLASYYADHINEMENC